MIPAKRISLNCLTADVIFGKYVYIIFVLKMQRGLWISPPPSLLGLYEEGISLDCIKVLIQPSFLYIIPEKQEIVAEIY